MGRPDQEPRCVRLIGGWSSCRVIDWSVRETRWADGWIKRTHITHHLNPPPTHSDGHGVDAALALPHHMPAGPGHPWLPRHRG